MGTLALSLEGFKHVNLVQPANIVSATKCSDLGRFYAVKIEAQGIS